MTTSEVCEHARGGRLCALYRNHRGNHRYRASLEDAPLKVCPRCDRAQPLATAFQHRSNGTVFSWCKSCNRAYEKDRRAAKQAGRG